MCPRLTHAASGTLRVDPATQNAAAGQEFTIKVIQNADVATAGSQMSLQFDPSCPRGGELRCRRPLRVSAQLLQAGTPEEAIASANSSGLLACIATFYVPGTGSVPPGDAEFLTITLRGKAGGSSPLALVRQGCNTTDPHAG